MAFKMKGPGLPGFRKNAGSGFYKGSGFNINTSNRSPMKDGHEGEVEADPNKYNPKLQNAWNKLSKADRAKWEAKGGWTKWSDWQYDKSRKLEFRTKTGDFEETTKSGGVKTHFGMDDACSEAYIQMNGNADCEGWTEKWGGESTQQTSLQQQETREKENKISYTNKVLHYEDAGLGQNEKKSGNRGKSADDGTPMIRVFDPNSDFSGIMSQAEFYAKYVNDGDLKIQTEQKGNRKQEFGTGKLYMSQDFHDTQFTPMLEHLEQNRENRIEFEASARESGMSSEEVNARLQNDPNLRLDVAGVHGFNKPIYGTASLGAPMRGSNEFLEQQIGLNHANRKKNSIAAQKIDPNWEGSYNYVNSVMPFSPDDFAYKDGNVTAMEGSDVPDVEDWIFKMNEKEKRAIVSDDDQFDYSFSLGNVDKDGNLPSSIHNSGSHKKFFNQLYDAQSKKLDFSKLDQNEFGDYIVDGRVMGDENEIMRMMGLHGLNSELGASLLEQFSGDLYKEEIKTDKHPEGDFDKAIDNRTWDKNKKIYVNIDPRVNPDGTERLSRYNITDRDVTDPLQTENIQKEEEEEEEE